jgi:UDP-GlcNAc:polypeptide alpha-N-acetylglucosaminyltransferase
MIKLLKSRGVKKPLLSHYPKILEDHDKEDNTVPTICKSFFNDRNMISFLGAHNITISEPKINAYVAGGMFFAESNFLKDVPFDPNLPYLFVGEEILHSARFWTHGWDIYTPTENVVYHYYTRENEPKIWTDKTYSDEDAHNKVKKLLGLENPDTIPSNVTENIDKYGLGKERTIEQYFQFTGINPQSKNVEKDFCYDN